MKYIEKEMKIKEIIERYPEVIEIFTENGIHKLDDKNILNMVGSLSLKNLLISKRIDIDSFMESLEDFIEENERKKNIDKISVMGLLPCPVRTPLLTKFNEFLEAHPEIVVDYELRAASVGLDWIKKDVIEAGHIENLADIFISAGFDLFFEKDLMGKFKENKVFKDITGIKEYNEDFENDEISLKDPKGDYSMLGVVPAIFLVNKEVLGDRKIPTSWKDLLSPEFENSVSLPIADFDLFNSILIHIDYKYGKDGVKVLGRTLLQSLHPAQMVKSDKFKENVPTVTIMPYFFSKMLKGDSKMVAVWPEDGAIISPIFMLTKDNGKDNLEDIAKFLAGKEIGEVLSHEGLFPSVNPDVENHINGKYMWCGWDYIYSNDIGKVLEENKKIFFEKSEVK